MSLDRRDLLKWGALGPALAATSCASTRRASGLQRRPPDPGLVELAEVALSAAEERGASYADCRIADYRRQSLYTREARVTSVTDSAESGFGVRVIVDGTWGFAASPILSRKEIARVTARAVALARGNALLQREPVELAPNPVHVAVWDTPIRRDPFEVPLDQKVERLLSINARALEQKGVSYCRSGMDFVREHKLFASSEGARIEQTLHRCNPSFTVTAVDRSAGTFETRNSYASPQGRGYEYVEDYPWFEDVERAAEDVREKATAPSVEPGKHDLILDPTHLWLTIHESIGHPTEYDRAIGMEANYAGTSFLTPDKLGTFRLGSDIVSFVAEKTAPGALATCGFDDDGVKTMSWPLVQDGVFVDYQITRDQAHLLGRPGFLRVLVRPVVVGRALPAHAEHQPGQPAGRSLVRGARRGHGGGHPRSRARQLQHRSPALQLPVRRTDLLPGEEGARRRHAARRRLPGTHAGLLARLRRDRPLRRLRVALLVLRRQG